MQKEVLHNQTMLDVTLHHTGSLSRIFELAMSNNLSITSTLIPGSVLQTPSIDDVSMFDFFVSKYAIPATAVSQDVVLPFEKGGIGVMIIETNFIVR